MDILNVEKLTEERWLNLFAATFQHNGTTGRWIYASRKKEPHAPARIDAVVIVPLLHVDGAESRLVMVREFRVPICDYLYAFPAGLLEPGESIETAVRRELREETGLELRTVKRISPPLLSSAGLTDEANVLVFADVIAPPDARPQLDPSEEIEVLLLDHAAVCRLCEEREVNIDAKTWVVLHLYRLLGHFA